MANEGMMVSNLLVRKGSFLDQRSFSFNFDFSGQYTGGVQTIGNSAHEAIALGSDVTVPGKGIFRNCDATNFVQIGIVVSGVFYPFIKLAPGQGHPVCLANITLYAQADTAPVDLEFRIYEA